MRKMVSFESASLEALKLLAADKHRSFQDFMDEAVDDLLKKHRRPTTARDQFKQSLARPRGKVTR